jgi:uncharacterized protein
MLLTVNRQHPEIRRLLRLLRFPIQLEAEPLAARLREATDAPSALDAVMATVQKALSGSGEINQLMRAAILSQDLDGNKARRVAASLGLSIRSYFRYRSAAIELIAIAAERELEEPLVVDEQFRLEQQWRKKLKEALHMKSNCERCGAALSETAAAVICSYECTFCPACAAGVEFVCPNCGGELLARPRRSAVGVRKSAS